jgi:hypothetical protein
MFAVPEQRATCDSLDKDIRHWLRRRPTPVLIRTDRKPAVIPSAGDRSYLLQE